MIIAIDVGNTHIVMGCLDKDNIYFAARVSTDRVKTEDEYAITLKNLFQIKGVSPDPPSLIARKMSRGGAKAQREKCLS
jgi:pantothenate kinase type III